MTIRLTLLLTALCLAACATPGEAVDGVYYVRTDGNDAQAGTANTPEAAWATIEHALTQVGPGDEILVADGTYSTGGIVIDSLHGTAEAPITLKAINRHGAVLTRPETADPDISVVELRGSSYIIVEGFEIYDLHGIESGVDVRNGSHHITIRGNYIHDNACGGISSRLSDYLVFEENIVRDNAKRNQWNCSGISIWHPVEHDQAPGYHIIIRKNVAFENECDIPFAPHGHNNPTDGNGIIVDDFRNTQGGGQEGGYLADVLIENNLSFNNGGRGIHVYETDNITIRHNTVYHNLRVLSRYMDFPGDLTVSNSNGSSVYNNLVVQHPDRPTNALRLYDNDGENTRVHGNLVIGQVDFVDQPLDTLDNRLLDVSAQDLPQFAQASVDITDLTPEAFRSRFGLEAGSPAIDAALSAHVPEQDRDGVARPQGAGGDIGCYEWQAGD